MLSRRLAAQAPAWLAAAGARGAADKAGAVAKVQVVSDDGITTTTHGQAFVGDLRSTSALEVRARRCGSAPGPAECTWLQHERCPRWSAIVRPARCPLPQVGDNVFNHTKKWLQVSCGLMGRDAMYAVPPLLAAAADGPCARVPLSALACPLTPAARRLPWPWALCGRATTRAPSSTSSQRSPSRCTASWSRRTDVSGA